MAEYKYKVGDKVILGNNKVGHPWTGEMDHYVGKQAILRQKCLNLYNGWFLDIPHMYYWGEGNLTLVGCQCNIKNCITHTKARMEKTNA